MFGEQLMGGNILRVKVRPDAKTKLSAIDSNKEERLRTSFLIHGYRVRRWEKCVGKADCGGNL